MPPLKLLRCDCCKEDKPTGCFSASGAVRDYSAFCKSCQSWIKLIREAGRKEEFRHYTRRYKPQIELQRVWGIGL